MSGVNREITYTHWLPLITRCPVNGLLDPCYVTVVSPDLVDLYKIRGAIFSFLWKRKFMEDVAQELFDLITSLSPIDNPGGTTRVTKLELILLFNRHKVTLTGIPLGVV